LVQCFTLSNGLRVVAEPLEHVRSVSVGVWIATGARDEAPAQSGVSHFFEHMLFKGTTSHSAKQLAQVFDGIGGHVNAFTTKELTCVHAKCLDEHLELVLTTLAEMIFQSVFDEQEMEREKNVVMEEIKMYEDNPEEAVHDLIVERVFRDHPLGANILGTEVTLCSLTKRDLQDYVQHRYTPRNMVVSVCGRFEQAALQTLLERLFGSFDRSLHTLVAQSPPAFCAPADVMQRPVEQAHVCLAWPGYRYDSEDAYAMTIWNSIFGASSSSRLFQEIREARGMAYSVLSYHSAFRDTGLFAVYFGSSAAQAGAVFQLVLELVQQAVAQGITEAELARTKNQLRGSLLLGLESTSSRMSRAGKNELMLGRQVSLEETLAQVEAVTVEEVNALIARLFTEPHALVALGPAEIDGLTGLVAG